MPTTAEVLPGATAPNIVSEAEWCAARDALLVKEKAMTRARDALAAERRKLPMVRIEKPYVFDSPTGPVSLGELFDGRPQLLLYHFMYAPGVGGWPSAACPGCSSFLDNIGQFTMAHGLARAVMAEQIYRTSTILTGHPYHTGH